MEEKKEQHKKSIRFFNDREVRAVWDEEIIVGGFLQQTLCVPLTMSPTTPKLVTIGVG